MPENTQPAEANGATIVVNSRLIDTLGVPQLLALMTGLEIPNPEWWIANQPHESFRALGAAIAAQAKQVTDPPNAY